MALKSWKQIVTDIANAFRSLTGATANIKVGELAGKVSGIPKVEAQTITPSTIDQEIVAGRYLIGTQTIKGDANLTPSNIKKGISIFGNDGTLDNGEGQYAWKKSEMTDLWGLVSDSQFVMTNNSVNGVFTGYEYATNDVLYSYDGTTWNNAGFKANGILETNGKFLTSPNNLSYVPHFSSGGHAWTQTNLPSQNAVMSFHYMNNKYFVHISNNKLYYSSNGINWTQIDSAYTGIVGNYENKLYVARSSDKQLFSTMNGISFNSCNLPNEFLVNNYNYKLTYVGSKYFVCSFHYLSHCPVYCSTDGTSWTKTNISDSYFRSVYYAFGKYISFPHADSCNTAGILYSADGITWNVSNISVGEFQQSQIFEFAGKLFCLNDASDKLLYTTDGMNWNETEYRYGAISSRFMSDNILIIASGGSDAVYSSIDGISWTKELDVLIASSSITSNDKLIIFGAYSSSPKTYRMWQRSKDGTPAKIFISFLVSDNQEAYPIDGKDESGYYYESI